MQLIPYLNFQGNCGEAFRFYHQLFGGKVEIMTFGESPMAKEVPPEMHSQVIHAYLESDGHKLMGSDSPPDRFEKAQGIYVSTQPKTVAEGERIFNELAKGGTVIMPFAQTFWAQRFGMVIDRFGTPWMVNVGPA